MSGLQGVAAKLGELAESIRAKQVSRKKQLAELHSQCNTRVQRAQTDLQGEWETHVATLPTEEQCVARVEAQYATLHASCTEQLQVLQEQSTALQERVHEQDATMQGLRDALTEAQGHVQVAAVAPEAGYASYVNVVWMQHPINTGIHTATIIGTWSHSDVSAASHAVDADGNVYDQSETIVGLATADGTVYEPRL